MMIIKVLLVNLLIINCLAITDSQECDENEEFVECTDHCLQDTCIPRTHKCIGVECSPGCQCKKGYLRDTLKNFTCVRKEDCSSCGDNEHYSDCGTSCPKTCENYQTVSICDLSCNWGCFCNEGYVRNTRNGKCVKIRECPPSPRRICPRNEHFSENADTKEPTCDEPKPKTNATKEAKCVCNNGYLRNSSGVCVKEKDCKPICPINETWTCGNECGRRCRDYAKDIICAQSCKYGCFCKKGFVRDVTGKCVLPFDCLQAPECEDREKFYVCGACDGTCKNPNPPCPLICRIPGSCGCIPGFVRNSTGVCVAPCECPRRGSALKTCT